MIDSLRIAFIKVFNFDPGVLLGEKRVEAKRLLHGWNYGSNIRPVAVTDRLNQKDPENETQHTTG